MEKLKTKKEFFLSTEEFIEDFDFIYETLKTYYPFFDVNKEVHDIDWLGNREIYRQKICQCKTDKDFYNIINFEILSELNNGHTHILPWKMAINMYLYYRELKEPNWRLDLAKLLEKPRVVERNQITDENIEEINEHLSNLEEEENNESNIRVGDVIPGDVAYIEIKEMVHPNLNTKSFKVEYDIIKEYLQKIKNYPTLIIDIRGNEGGSSYYWSDFLMPLIVEKTYSQKTYSFIKEGEIYLKPWRHLLKNQKWLP